MANYNEIGVNSTSYQRAKSIHVTNEYGQDPFISFNEEIVVQLPDNKAAHQELGILSGSFNASNEAEEVALLDTTTGLPTASTITYAEIVNVIRSLYNHMATKRDAALAQLEADRLAAIAAIDAAVSAALASAQAAKAATDAALADVNAAVIANDPLAATTASALAQTNALTTQVAANDASNTVNSSPNASSQARADAASAQALAVEAQTIANNAATLAASIQPAP